MIKFLLQRPVAVLMVFLACVIIGIITYATLPVSLLPDIAIPEITVQITGDNMSARELENNPFAVNSCRPANSAIFAARPATDPPSYA